MSQTLPFDWGTWALGDLPELLLRAMDVVGPNADVHAAMVQPPDGAGALATVTLRVADSGEAERLRGEVEGCEFVSTFDRTDGPGWSCRVAGLRLAVTAEEVTR